MFLYFPLVRSMRNCNLFFWPLWVGQAQSGFNHKTPWPHARTEWGKLLVYLWRPYKHKHCCTAKQLSTACCRERRASKAAASGRPWQPEKRAERVHVLVVSVMCLFCSVPFFLLNVEVFKSTGAVDILETWIIWISHPEQVQCQMVWMVRVCAKRPAYTHIRLYFYTCEDPYWHNAYLNPN